MTANRYAVWFSRAVWLGVLANLSFAVPALTLPGVLSTSLGLGGLSPPAAVGMRNVGMLLLVLSGFHALATGDPLRTLGLARWVVAGRLLAAAFWAWLASDYPGLWWLFAMDLTLGLMCGFLLWRANAIDPPPAAKPWQRSLYDRLYGGLFTFLERRLGVRWYHLWPPLLGSIAGGGLRRELRGNNLYALPGDTPDDDAHRIDKDDQNPLTPLGPWNPSYRDSRSSDGSYNDLSDPAMGMAGMRFGRNVPATDAWPKVPPEGGLPLGADGKPDASSQVRYPCPRAISRELLARPTGLDGKPRVIEADILNVLAAAWIQFQNHGWFNHRIPKLKKTPGGFVPVHPTTGEPVQDRPEDYVTISLDAVQDNEFVTKSGQSVMRVRRTPTDPTRRPDAGYPPTYRTTDTHWWDGSQLYGNSAKELNPLREWAGGRMKTVEGSRGETLLPLDDGGLDLTGMNENYWVGVSLLHHLFVLEHNHLCGELQRNYAADMSGRSEQDKDEWLFGKARLIVAAMMAKIHTVEWTPAILPNPRLIIDMDSNWWGVLGRWFKLRFGRVSENEGVSGIIGSRADHHAAPYALTEEFVAVYRLHPLIPDELRVTDPGTSYLVETMPFADVQGTYTRRVLLQHGSVKWLYSLGRQKPGAVTLRNYPRALQMHERTTGELIDLATRDIVRDRERGIPSYNRFREHLRMRPKRTYEELVGPHPDRDNLIAKLRELYGPDGVDRVDLMVGLFAEEVPPHYGFSDTAFRVFILMASRRLKSDRFFTDDFRPEVYTQFGIDWVNAETMQTLIERHHPALKGKVPAGRHVFAPWGA